MTPTAADTHPVTVEVDGEPVKLPGSEATPNSILRDAGLDPATHYLVLVNGREQEPLRDGDAVIHVHERETFVSVSTRPTPTS